MTYYIAIYVLIAGAVFALQILLARKSLDIMFGLWGKPDAAEIFCSSLMWPATIQFAFCNGCFFLTERIMKK